MEKDLRFQSSHTQDTMTSGNGMYWIDFQNLKSTILNPTSPGGFRRIRVKHVPDHLNRKYLAMRDISWKNMELREKKGDWYPPQTDYLYPFFGGFVKMRPIKWCNDIVQKCIDRQDKLIHQAFLHLNTGTTTSILLCG